MWTTFAAITGGAGGGLTSLTFLVVAFRFETIAVSQEYRNRAAQTLLLFVTLTVIAVLLTVPQRIQALGTEMILIALISAVMLKSLDTTARRQQTTKPSRAFAFALMVFVTLILVTGLLLLLNKNWSMYFYVVSAVDGLVSGVYGSWLFLTQAGLANASTNHP